MRTQKILGSKGRRDDSTGEVGLCGTVREGATSPVPSYSAIPVTLPFTCVSIVVPGQGTLWS